jgi:hypothetical protein
MGDKLVVNVTRMTISTNVYRDFIESQKGRDH